MIYTPLTQKALQIALSVYKGMVDMDNLPYIYNILYKAEQMETEDEVIVVLLHGLNDNKKPTSDNLRKNGFSKNVIEALAILSLSSNVISYQDYYLKLLPYNSTAWNVDYTYKINNRYEVDLPRIITDEMIERWEKYIVKSEDQSETSNDTEN